MNKLTNIDQFILGFTEIDIPVKRVFKLYYKKYPYRLTIDHNVSQQPTIFTIRSYKESELNNHTILMLYMGDCFGAKESIRMLNDESLKIYDSKTLNVFFAKQDMFVKFSLFMKEYVSGLSIVANDNIATILAQDDYAVIKKEYYFKKFPYRIQLARYKLDKFLTKLDIIEDHKYRYNAEIEKLNREAKQEYFQEWAKDNLKKPFHKCKIRVHQEVPTLFFLKYEDVILFKMQFADFIDNIDRVKLLKSE